MLDLEKKQARKSLEKEFLFYPKAPANIHPY